MNVKRGARHESRAICAGYCPADGKSTAFCMSAQAHSTTKPTKPSLQSSEELSSLPAPSRHAPSVKSALQPSAFEPRRSKRVCRPSARQIESDAYESSRASTRPSTPSTPDPEPDPKPKSKKRKSSKPGNRPGRIVQPAVNTRTARYSSSPEPFTASRSQHDDSVMASQGPAGGEVEIITREEGIRRATKYLGTDASHLSNETLKKVLQEAPDRDEEGEASPVEPAGGSAPAVLQSTRRMVLENRHRMPTTTTADGVDSPQGSSAQLASRANAPVALNQPRPDEPMNADSATEPESEPEFIELRPEDSVSQRIPRLSQPQHASPLPLSPHLPLPAAIASTPSIHKVNQSNHVPTDSDSPAEDKSSTSNSDRDTRASKRQRFTQLPRVAHSAHARTSHAGPSITQPDTISITRPPRPAKSSGEVPRSLTHSQTAQSVVLSAPRRARTPFTAPGPSLALPPSSSTATSDANLILAWLNRPAEQAGTSRPNIDVDRLAGAFDCVRSRLNVAAPKSQNSVPRSLKRPRDTDLIEDDAEILEAEAVLELRVHA
ncbi:hypothetical protein FRC07_008961, partial [Ceratobasidium sp. 392]